MSSTNDESGLKILSVWEWVILTTAWVWGRIWHWFTFVFEEGQLRSPKTWVKTLKWILPWFFMRKTEVAQLTAESLMADLSESSPWAMLWGVSKDAFELLPEAMKMSIYQQLIRQSDLQFLSLSSTNLHFDTLHWEWKLEEPCTLDKKSLLPHRWETYSLGNPSLIASHTFVYIHFDWPLEVWRFPMNHENVLISFLSCSKSH